MHTPRDDPNGPRNPVRAAPVSPSTGRRAGVLDGFCTVRNGAKAEALQRLAPVYGGPSLCCAGALTKTGLIATGVRRTTSLGHASGVMEAIRASGCCDWQYDSDDRRRCVIRWVKGAACRRRIDGHRRGARTTILLSAGCSDNNAERVVVGIPQRRRC